MLLELLLSLTPAVFHGDSLLPTSPFAIAPTSQWQEPVPVPVPERPHKKKGKPGKKRPKVKKPHQPPVPTPEAPPQRPHQKDKKKPGQP